MRSKIARFPHLFAIGIAVILISGACLPQPTPLPVDAIGTSIALGVFAANTLTAAVPTSLPTGTATQTPFVTNTPYTLQNPVVNKLAPCWFGPGNAYNMESNIQEGESVEMAAVGSVPGWYIIINPYYGQPCWIRAEDLDMDPLFSPSLYPLFTPYPTRIPPIDTPKLRGP